MRRRWRINGVCRVCNAHGPSAVLAQNSPDVFFQDESPKSAENRFRVNTFLAAMDRACTQIKERFLSMNSVAMTFGIMFPSILLSASGDELYAAAESPAKQYYTGISSAFPSQFLSFCSCFHSQLSTKSTILKVAHLLLIDYHALSSTFSNVLFVRPTRSC